MLDTLKAALSLLRDATPLPTGWLYRGAADFVLRHGETSPLTPWRKHWPAGAPKCCFGNAVACAEVYGWRYVEGYALAPVDCDIPFLHAWNLTAEGELRDTTWRNGGLAYLGVPFALGRADDATWNGDACVLNDYRRQHPLFRQSWQGEDWLRVWEPSEGLLLMRALRESQSRRAST